MGMRHGQVTLVDAQPVFAVSMPVERHHCHAQARSGEPVPSRSSWRQLWPWCPGRDLLAHAPSPYSSTGCTSTTYGSFRHGESVKTVQARLGHANAAETLDTCSHLWPDSDDRTREAVDHVLGIPAEYILSTAATSWTYPRRSAAC